MTYKILYGRKVKYLSANVTLIYFLVTSNYINMLQSKAKTLLVHFLCRLRKRKLLKKVNKKPLVETKGEIKPLTLAICSTNIQNLIKFIFLIKLIKLILQKIYKMARKIDPESVSSKVAELTLGENIRFENPYTSVMVMVSNLKKKEAHKDKLFKIKYVDGITTVSRVK